MTKKHMWLRLLSLLLICGMILGCFAGCSDDAGEAPEVEKIDRTEPNDSPIMPDGGQITLSVWTPNEDEDWLNDRLEAFERQYPQYEITWIIREVEDIVIELSENPHFDTVHKYGGEILVTSLVEKFLKLKVLSGYNEKKRFSASGQNAVAGAENAF